MARLYVILVGSISLALFGLQYNAMAQGSGQAEVIIEALVPGCGDLVIESGEECDGGNLNGSSCFSKGYTSGVLSCTASCVFNTSACVYTPPISSGGGSGRGSNRGAQVVLTGHAYPKSEVTVLKDAQVVATTIADEMANFQVRVGDLSAGTYIFSIYSEDAKGIRSSLFTFPVTVTRGILAKIDSIFVAPTLTGDKIEVKKGEPITFFGQSVPSSFITIEVNSLQAHFAKTSTDESGFYLYNFDSMVLEFGQHHAKSRATAGPVISTQSSAYGFTVGDKDIYSEEKKCPKKADFNADCRVNLVDFSIVAFWYLRSLSPAFLIRESTHLNGDGKINLTDFSIMAFYWTG